MLTSRTRVVATIGALAVAIAALTACGSATKKATDGMSTTGSFPKNGGLTLTKEANPGKVVWVDAGGALLTANKKAILDPFTAKTGITFETLSPPDIAQIKAQVVAGKTIWDVVGVGPSTILNNCGTLFEKLDLSLFDKLDQYPENSITPCLVPASKSAFIFSYNTDVFSGNSAPTSIKDFFDTKKFPGKRIIFDDAASSGIYEAALVADGVDPKKLYPLDITRAEKKMNQIKNDLVLEPTFSAAQTDLQSNKWALTLMLTGRSIASVNGGAHMKPVWNWSLYTPSGNSIVKNAPNLANAQKAVAYAASKEAELSFAEANGLYPFRPDIKPDEVNFNAQQKEWNAFENNRGTSTLQDPVWYSNNTNALVASYTKWKVG